MDLEGIYVWSQSKPPERLERQREDFGPRANALPLPRCPHTRPTLAA
jgi:hypothetical protein